MLIVGGGFIACELACILNGMGVEVMQVYRGEQVLRGFDGEARGHLAALIRAQGVDLRTGTDVAHAADTADGVRVRLTDGSEHVFSKVVYATGRVPNTEGLGA